MALRRALAPTSNPRSLVKRSAGFTLIELLVTIGLVGILAALAVPSFSEAMRSNRVSAAANLTMATFAYARTEAIRSKTTSSVCPRSKTDDKCGTAWADGLTVWTDDNGNLAWDAGETRRKVEPTKGVDFAQTSGTAAIKFDSRGRVDDQTTRTFTVTAQACKAGSPNKRELTVSVVGQVTIEKGVCS
ncbi:GspH/FimT family pseudopilin [Lysobacter sp. CA199]|uniref:GspH/FimT family pseudopilin n=1 Tax=Lysobacter sp. CA199 TaxID=3455608 RepID=UPI003F8CF4C4